MSQVISDAICPSDLLIGAFLTNHLADIDKTKHKCNQEHTQQTK